MITTTELIKILQDNEMGGITHKPRKISLTVNGRYLPEPQITISSTGDGICGPEIDFDVDGEWVEPESCDDAKRWIPVSEELPEQGQEVICQCRANMIKVLKLDADFDWYQDADHCYMNGFVIAWMPLPEPYKAESETAE